ncbi:MAG: substrate-binding domain-containing protein, partial [Lachnospiraceae bacterium]|nr:substrate-binding domain-containing protein [Lachnospiraceae bacterium]
YIDNGQLVIKSGQKDFATVATQGWSTENAQNRFDAIISAYYSDGTQLDAVMASNDSTAQGVTTSLENNYTGAWPIITGQDCDIVSVQNMIAGKQSMSIFKDTRTLAAKTVEMVDAILKGGEAPVNDKETYDNGTGIIPSYLCEPVFADINNYEELLIDSGYYTEDQLK